MNNNETDTLYPKLQKTMEISKSILQWAGVVVLLANIWLAAKLAPLAQNDLVIITRVSALEETSKSNLPVLDDIKIIKEQVINLHKSMEELKEELRYQRRAGQ